MNHFITEEEFTHMKLLALDSSAVSAGCAVMEDGRLVAESFVKVGLTHSETLLPMAANTLANAKMSVEDIDCFAVSVGPGSFTGVRIGVAAVKGMAFPRQTPCIGVSTLEAMAWNCLGREGVVCSVMDARRQQVYNALFTFEGDKLTRLCDDRAIAIEELTDELAQKEGKILLVGDGAKLCYEAMRDKLPDVMLMPEHLQYQRGFGVAMAAQQKESVPPEQLVPVYLRPSQAERELKKKP